MLSSGLIFEHDAEPEGGPTSCANCGGIFPASALMGDGICGDCCRKSEPSATIEDRLAGAQRLLDMAMTEWTRGEQQYAINGVNTVCERLLVASREMTAANTREWARRDLAIEYPIL